MDVQYFLLTEMGVLAPAPAPASMFTDIEVVTPIGIKANCHSPTQPKQVMGVT